MKYYVFILLLAFVMCMPLQALAGKGCCSWHGGQDYCDEETGRWVCKDKTYSPTCRCGTIPSSESTSTQSKRNDINWDTIIALALLFLIFGFPTLLFVFEIIKDIIINIKQKINKEKIDNFISYFAITLAILVIIATIIAMILII